MSLKKIGQIKEGKLFRVWDLLIYGVIAVIIAAIFLAVFLTRDSSPLSGVRITAGGDTVFEYNFESDKYALLKADRVEITANNGDKLELTFHTADGGGYNKIVIDKKKKSVTVTDANCSNRKDCVHTPAITDNSKSIICPPHAMTIEPLKREIRDDGNIIM